MIGDLASAADLEGIEVPDDVTVVWGETWEGVPTLRPVRSGYSSCLRGEHGRRFDIRGPGAWKCRECGELLVSSTSPIYPVDIQRHYATVHGFTPALLP
ncbi:hypothetical protein SEA_OBLADI_163 [Gordonia phage ObLaDi]|uniref:Uncharacterized protein n=2 Tax=Cafassovirus TaxID=3425056 RepID=A0A9E7QD26_9CAUD|nr:hypothetical protein SEA_ALEEMILY_161 [Gordonia phage Aleemily]UXE03886.1 hypothetical protein SEA_OBLADI_163 [Gordonia phage ObLaDi]